MNDGILAAFATVIGGAVFTTLTYVIKISSRWGRLEEKITNVAGDVEELRTNVSKLIWERNSSAVQSGKGR